jgi:hypothetical protein
MTTPTPQRRRGRATPPVPAPPATEAPRGVDLGAHHRTIMQQIQAAEQRLIELEHERAQAFATLNAWRGKLELLAEIAQELNALQGAAPTP